MIGQAMLGQVKDKVCMDKVKDKVARTVKDKVCMDKVCKDKV